MSSHRTKLPGTAWSLPQEGKKGVKPLPEIISFHSVLPDTVIWAVWKSSQSSEDLNRVWGFFFCLLLLLKQTTVLFLFYYSPSDILELIMKTFP